MYRYVWIVISFSIRIPNKAKEMLRNWFSSLLMSHLSTVFIRLWMTGGKKRSCNFLAYLFMWLRTVCPVIGAIMSLRLTWSPSVSSSENNYCPFNLSTWNSAFRVITPVWYIKWCKKMKVGFTWKKKCKCEHWIVTSTAVLFLCSADFSLAPTD